MPESLAAPYDQLFVGVDIAAASFDASWCRAGSTLHPAQTFPQTPSAFTAFQQQLETTGVPPAQTLLVLEATGSYWVALATSLHAAGYAVAIVNPA
ncbi:MAG TPA: transposase, partial [Herpetosiphonaceae bacterium]|nr:transposase [Herpetosiphonaceae bacterium]